MKTSIGLWEGNSCSRVNAWRYRLLSLLTIAAAIFLLSLHAHLSVETPWLARQFPPHQSSVQTRPQEKYLIKHWHLWLGWNNIRYFIESGLEYAALLNRTLVLPPLVFMRSCDVDLPACSAAAPQLGHDDAHKDIDLSPSHWAVPLELMLDVDHLVANAPAITFEAFFSEHDLTLPRAYQQAVKQWTSFPHGSHPDVWTVDDILIQDLWKIREGIWLPEWRQNLSFTEIFEGHVLTNKSVIVDRLPDARNTPSQHGVSAFASSLSKLRLAFTDSERIWTARKSPKASKQDESSCEAPLDMTCLYTYSELMRRSRAPVDPLTVVGRSVDLVDLKASVRDQREVLWLSGYWARDHAPGDLYFTSPTARAAFTDMILSAVRPPKVYHYAASQIEDRMMALTGGRALKCAHMRRGDFVQLGWEEKSIYEHYASIAASIQRGLAYLQERPNMIKTVSPVLGSQHIPQVDDPIYIATDADSPADRALLRNVSVFFTSDFLTPSLRASLGMAGIFLDTLGVMEQLLLSHCAVFYGSSNSSFAGGVLALRAANGVHRRLSVFE